MNWRQALKKWLIYKFRYGQITTNFCGGKILVNLLNYWNRKCCNLHFETNSFLYCNKIYVHGMNNIIKIGKGCRIKKVEFHIYGDNNHLLIGDNVILRNAIIHLGDDNNTIKLGDNLDSGGGLQLYALESTKIEIGDGCMLSTNVSVRTSDAHAIVDMKTGLRLNQAKSVIIGKHVWLGADVTCLKGAEIGSYTVVGARSVLTCNKYEDNCVYAGCPARLLKREIQWMMKR